jgi:glutamine synthetase
MTIVEYIWLDGDNNLRSKTRIIDTNTIPDWNFDGSSTNQATTNKSEIIIKPRTVFKDPFRKNNSLMVICDTWVDNIPHKSNTRIIANNLFNKKLEEKPWYGLEQEYFIFNNISKNELKKYTKQGQYYCSVGTGNSINRTIAEEHLQLCLYAGIKISGINAEVAPSQWEFQIGPCEGIDAGDHLWVARYILLRVAEKYNSIIDFEPKPIKGDMNGSGCHINFSTVNMRNGTDKKSGLEYIYDGIKKLEKNHKIHMEYYGHNNNERLTGKHETSSYDTFTHAEASRGASIRIGKETILNKKGYFEDRRPASNIDPYMATSIIFKTICL